MIDEATLATMIGAFLWLVYHCREWKKEKTEFSQWMDSRFEAFAVRSGDVMEVLEDILDGIGAAPSPGPKPSTGGSIPEMLTALLMSNMNIGSQHAPSQERTIQEEVSDQTQTETENEPD